MTDQPTDIVYENIFLAKYERRSYDAVVYSTFGKERFLFSFPSVVRERRLCRCVRDADMDDLSDTSGSSTREQNFGVAYG
jgi:hypothetical protein